MFVGKQYPERLGNGLEDVQAAAVEWPLCLYTRSRHLDDKNYFHFQKLRWKVMGKYGYWSCWQYFSLMADLNIYCIMAEILPLPLSSYERNNLECDVKPQTRPTSSFFFSYFKLVKIFSLSVNEQLKLQKTLNGNCGHFNMNWLLYTSVILWYLSCCSQFINILTRNKEWSGNISRGL